MIDPVIDPTLEYVYSEMPRVAPIRELVYLDDGSVVDAFVGFRAWRMRARDGEVRLHSLFTWGVPWPTSETLEFICDNTMCAAPRMPHTCGIYAWRTPRDMMRVYRNGQWDVGAIVMGEAHLWGERVAIHEFGYRAQFARIARLYVDKGEPLRHSDRVLVEAAALRYRVPLVSPKLPVESDQ